MSDRAQCLVAFVVFFMLGAFAAGVPMAIALNTVARERDAWIEMYGVLADEKNVLEVDR